MNDLKVNALKILNNSHLIEVITILYIFLLTEIHSLLSKNGQKN